MGAVYEVYLYSNTGTQLACLTKRLTRLEWNRIVNDQGSFAITLSDKLDPVDVAKFMLNGRIAIYRKPDPLGMSRLEMVGFIRGWDFETDIRGVTRYTWYGPDQNCLLADRVFFPFSAGFWAPNQGGYADTAMRELVEHNLGSGDSNSTARDVVTANGAGLTIAIESSATTTSCSTPLQWTHECGGKSLLRCCQEICSLSKSLGTTPVPIFFDMCTDSDVAFTFRTFANRRGINHRSDSGQAVHIGIRYGNLSMPRWQHDRTREINAVLTVRYAMSYSSAEWSLDDARIGQSPLNRREMGTTSSGQELLNEGKPKPRFSGKIQSAPGSLYGLHWGLGDELTADYLDQQYNVRVLSVGAGVVGGREQMATTFEVLDT
jgi:hypothetical protein